jgi:hypothetical protein
MSVEEQPGSARSPSISRVPGDRRRASFLGSMTRFARRRTDVFQASRLPFDPGSTGAAVRAADPASYVEGPWSPALLRMCAEGPFSLRRGLDSELALVQAEHRPFSFRLSKRRRRPSGRPRCNSHAPCSSSSACTSQRGQCCRPAFAGTGVPSRRWPLWNRMNGCSRVCSYVECLFADGTIDKTCVVRNGR